MMKEKIDLGDDDVLRMKASMLRDDFDAMFDELAKENVMPKNQVSTQIVIPELPADLTDFFESNVAPRTSVNQLKIGGRKWTVSIDGTDTVLTKTNAEGEREEVQIPRLFILAYAERRARAYYEGTYDQNNIKRPDCWSKDGVKPDESIEAPQHSKCEGCPKAAKNSRAREDGSGSIACSQHRYLAVVPVNLKTPPLRLKVPITSDWDTKSPDMEAQGWLCFSKYIDLLTAKMRSNVHTGRVVTKLKFDPSTKITYPKFFFGVDRATRVPEEINNLKAYIDTHKDEIDKIIAGGYDAPPAGAKALSKSSDDDEGDDGDEEVVVTPPKAPAKAPGKVSKPAPAPAPVVDEDDEDGDGDEEVVVTPPKAPAKAPGKVSKPKADTAPSPTTEAASDPLDGLLGEWDS